MRWLPAVALLLVASAGCIGPSSGNVFHIGEDCSSSRQIVTSASADVLLPATMPAEARDSFGPRASVTVTAREGQTVHAIATWVTVAGEVEVLFDGPTGTAIQTDNTWQSSGMVAAGDYTLELAGDPMAFDVTYTLYIVASGCTPVEG